MEVEKCLSLGAPPASPIDVCVGPRDRDAGQVGDGGDHGDHDFYDDDDDDSDQYCNYPPSSGPYQHWKNRATWMW